MDKDYKAVNKHYEKCQAEEFVICHVLNTHMFNLHSHWIRAGLSFRVNGNKNQYGKYDIILTYTSLERNETIIARGEFEFGLDQNRHDNLNKNWDYEFPETHWDCLSLMTRKIYDVNFEFFLKVSPTYNSAFIIDTRNNFVGKTSDVKEDLENDSTNEKFETDTCRYKLLWKTVNNNLFKYESQNLINDGNICLIENNVWNNLFAFIYIKYFNEEIKKAIKREKILLDKLRNEQVGFIPPSFRLKMEQRLP